MGKKHKNVLKDLMYNLQNIDVLQDDDLSQMIGGTTHHTHNDADDGMIGDDVPL